MESLLEVSLDIGITEDTFWGMCVDEIKRRVDSFNRVQQREFRNRATLAWKLGDLIGVSVGRIHSRSARYPEIHEVFPTMFEDKQITVEKQDEISAIRFRAFAQAFNRKMENQNA